MEMDNNISGIPGDMAEYVNAEDALKRVGGNAKLYKTLLKSFSNNTYMAPLSEQLSAGDIESAAKTAHTIKGVCANLSLKKVNTIAATLEQELKNSLPYQNSYDELSAAVEKTLQYIAIYSDSM